MKQNKIAIALLIGVVAFTPVMRNIATNLLGIQTVYGATNNAIGQDVNITYNGKTAELGAYNIDGYNYFRIADIGSILNIATTQEQVYLGSEYYIKMVADQGYDAVITPVSTATIKADVTLGTMKLQFDNYTGAIQQFNLNDRNYFKLGDIVSISKENYSQSINAVKERAQQGIGTKVSEGVTATKLDTIYDGDTKTITLTKTVTDLQKIYEDEYYKSFGADQFKQAFGKGYNNMGETGNKMESQKGVIAPTPTSPTSSAVTTPPEVGSFPAKILKDSSKGAYLDNGDANWDNITTPYDQGSLGQCTWYAMGRYHEVFGIPFPQVIAYNLSEVQKNPTLKVITDPKQIVSNSIAVFGNQHLMYVEYVEKDQSGNPTNIYITEANADGNDKYDLDADGQVKKYDLNSFINRVYNAPYKGCITKQ